MFVKLQSTYHSYHVRFYLPPPSDAMDLILSVVGNLFVCPHPKDIRNYVGLSKEEFHTCRTNFDDCDVIVNGFSLNRLILKRKNSVEGNVIQTIYEFKLQYRHFYRL